MSSPELPNLPLEPLVWHYFETLSPPLGEEEPTGWIKPRAIIDEKEVEVRFLIATIRKLRQRYEGSSEVECREFIENPSKYPSSYALGPLPAGFHPEHGALKSDELIFHLAREAEELEERVGEAPKDIHGEDGLVFSSAIRGLVAEKLVPLVHFFLNEAPSRRTRYYLGQVVKASVPFPFSLAWGAGVDMWPDTVEGWVGYFWDRVLSPLSAGERGTVVEREMEACLDLQEVCKLLSRFKSDVESKGIRLEERLDVGTRAKLFAALSVLFSIPTLDKDVVFGGDYFQEIRSFCCDVQSSFREFPSAPWPPSALPYFCCACDPERRPVAVFARPPPPFHFRWGWGKSLEEEEGVLSPRHSSFVDRANEANQPHFNPQEAEHTPHAPPALKFIFGVVAVGAVFLQMRRAGL